VAKDARSSELLADQQVTPLFGRHRPVRALADRMLVRAVPATTTQWSVC